MPGFEIFFHLAYCGVVKEHVTDHKGQPVFRGKLEKVATGFHFGRQRFLDQYVLTSLKRLFGEGVVSARGRGDDNGVYRRVAQCLLRIFRSMHIWEISMHLVQSGRIAVDYPDDFARLFVMKIPNEVRPPLASPNHGHTNHCHSCRRHVALPSGPVPAARKSRSAPGRRGMNRSGLFQIYTKPHGASPSPKVRRRRAGFPATTVRGATFLVTTAPAPTIAPAPIVTPPRMTAPDPIVARRSTTMGITFQSTSVCKVPSGRHARGNRSLMKHT